MKIYSDSLKLSKYQNTIENKGDSNLGKKSKIYEHWILTNDGKYKIAKDSYIKYKIQSGECFTVENYINDTTLFCDDTKYKKFTEVFSLPLEHKKITINKFIYHKFSTLTLIIEKINDKFHDIYFETDEDIKNNHIKEAIGSFLSILS